jgi:hypothetical protein
MTVIQNYEYKMIHSGISLLHFSLFAGKGSCINLDLLTMFPMALRAWVSVMGF